ncbi:MAG: cache domain-containing protein [Pseudomonadales bacterium]
MRFVYKSLLSLLLVCLAASSAVAVGEERGTPREAKALLQEAVALLESEGAEKALSQFNDRKSRFSRGDLYIFAMDLEGSYLASGANLGLVGQNFFKQHAAAGREIDRDMLMVPNDGDRDIFEYEWLNRKTNKLETKFSYVQRIGEIVLGVGIYVPSS